jgi:dihydroneopterin aldolase
MSDGQVSDRRMSDRIEIIGLRVRGHHGVLATERELGQDFLVDALLDCDISRAAATDDLAMTVNYATLAEELAQIIAGDPVDLIETLAERLASVCLAHPTVTAVELTVHKPEAPVGLPFTDVRVRIHRP